MVDRPIENTDDKKLIESFGDQWIKRVKDRLTPLSEEKDSVYKALKEWVYQGDMRDLDEVVESCGLCGHNPIRYQFEIKNINNANSLLIGSECITRFGGVAVVDEMGQVLDKTQAEKKVKNDRGKLIVAAKTRSVINSIIELKAKDEGFNIGFDELIKYYSERGSFTPRQLHMLIWRMEKMGVTFNKKHFKMTIRRKREKNQYLKMPGFQLKRIADCLSEYQKEWLRKRADIRTILMAQEANK